VFVRSGTRLRVRTVDDAADWRDQLHDGVLTAVLIDFENGTARFEIDLHETARAVVCAFDGSVHVPRQQPWGPSASVNELRVLEDVSTGKARLEVEMQSGDVLVVEGVRDVGLVKL
jgi:hypothetical protein